MMTDPIADMLASAGPVPARAARWGPELMAYSDEALREELERRESG